MRREQQEDAQYADIGDTEETDNKMLVTLKCNERAMKYWALQYGGHIEIKEPQSLRETVKAAISDMAKKYAE